MRRIATRVLRGVWIAALLTGCASVQPGVVHQDAKGAALQQQGRAASDWPPRAATATQVAIFGVLHRSHLKSYNFSLSYIEAVLRKIRPDVVLVEVPPDRFERGLAEVAAAPGLATPEDISDSWLRAFPEIYRVAYPQQSQLGYELVPVSGWQPRVSRDRKAYWDSNPRGPNSEQYRSAQAAFDEAKTRHRPTENPRWVNGNEYLAVSGAARRALSRAADEQLGAAAVGRINAAHFRLIDAAIRRHAGKRILLLFGARHRWYFQPRIAEMDGVELVPLGRFLP